MNVVVVAAHGLCCHGLGPYGNAWLSTPAADALAAEAVVFDHHIADDPTPAGFRLSCPTTVLQSLRAAGVMTVVVDDRKDRAPDDRPWDLVVATDPASRTTPADALALAVASALDRLDGRTPWLLWVETDRLIPPWDLELETYQQYAATSRGFAEGPESEVTAEVEPTDEPTPGPFVPDDDRNWHRLHNSFAAAVTSFDAELASLMMALRDRGLDQTAAWVLTSGHGWPLGEHGIVGPAGSRMHEELVHLPLIVRLPARRQGLRRVSAFTQPSDLGPTLLDLFELPHTGPSLLPLMVGATPEWRSVARSADQGERGLRTADWAFLPAVPEAGRPPRLYRKPDDIWEANDIAQRHPDECDRLTALFDGTTEKEPPT